MNTKIKIILIIISTTYWSVMSVFSQITCPIEKHEEVWKVLAPLFINGIKHEGFYIDNGSSNILMSTIEFNFLKKQGLIKADDIKEPNEYIELANGDSIKVKIVTLKTVKFLGMKLSNIDATVIYSHKAPLLLGSNALNEFGRYEIDPNKQTITFLDASNIFEFNLMQKIFYSLFKNNTSKALRLIFEENDCKKANLLLEKVKTREKNEMKISYKIAKSICVKNNCNTNEICDINCDYLRLRKYYEFAKDNYSKATKKDLFYLQKFKWHNEIIDYSWILKEYIKYQKFFSEKALEILVNKTDTLGIGRLIDCSNNLEESKHIKITKMLVDLLMKEIYNTGRDIICEDLRKIKLSISKGEKSKEDERILNSNNINIDSIINSKIDSLCVRKTILALKSMNESKKDCNKIKYYIKEAKVLEDDLTEIPFTYFSTLATYYNICLKDSVSYCYYHELADSCKVVKNAEDSLIFETYKKLIINSDCETYLTKEADIYVSSLNNFKNESKNVEKLVNNITINNIPLNTHIEKLGVKESIILTDIPIWASDRLEKSIYKDAIIDKAITLYFQYILDFINNNKTSETEMSVSILGTADGNSNSGIEYKPIVNNETNISYEVYKVIKEIDIDDFSFNKHNSNKIQGKIISHEILDEDLAYLRAYNILSLLNNVSNNNINSRDIYIYDYPDIEKYKSKEFRLVKIRINIHNLLYTKQDFKNKSSLIEAIRMHELNKTNKLHKQ